MDMIDALRIITDKSIPCAERLRTAMSINLEPRQSCAALERAGLMLRGLDSDDVRMKYQH